MASDRTLRASVSLGNDSGGYGEMRGQPQTPLLGLSGSVELGPRIPIRAQGFIIDPYTGASYAEGPTQTQSQSFKNVDFGSTFQPYQSGGMNIPGMQVPGLPGMPGMSPMQPMQSPGPQGVPMGGGFGGGIPQMGGGPIPGQQLPQGFGGGPQFTGGNQPNFSGPPPVDHGLQADIEALTRPKDAIVKVGPQAPPPSPMGGAGPMAPPQMAGALGPQMIPPDALAAAAGVSPDMFFDPSKAIRRPQKAQQQTLAPPPPPVPPTGALVAPMMTPQQIQQMNWAATPNPNVDQATVEALTGEIMHDMQDPRLGSLAEDFNKHVQAATNIDSIIGESPDAQEYKDAKSGAREMQNRLDSLSRGLDDEENKPPAPTRAQARVSVWSGLSQEQQKRLIEHDLRANDPTYDEGASKPPLPPKPNPKKGKLIEKSEELHDKIDDLTARLENMSPTQKLTQPEKVSKLKQQIKDLTAKGKKLEAEYNKEPDHEQPSTLSKVYGGIKKASQTAKEVRSTIRDLTGIGSTYKGSRNYGDPLYRQLEAEQKEEATGHQKEIDARRTAGQKESDDFNNAVDKVYAEAQQNYRQELNKPRRDRTSDVTAAKEALAGHRNAMKEIEAKYKPQQEINAKAAWQSAKLQLEGFKAKIAGLKAASGVLSQKDRKEIQRELSSWRNQMLEETHRKNNIAIRFAEVAEEGEARKAASQPVQDLKDLSIANSAASGHSPAAKALQKKILEKSIPEPTAAQADMYLNQAFKEIGGNKNDPATVQKWQDRARELWIKSFDTEG